MLTSKLKSGEVISLGEHYDRESLLLLRKRERFFCRTCGEEAILKLGSKKIPHFAHIKGSSCTDEYDRESEYHMQGKIQLYNWLKNQGLCPELETYYPAIKQRADIAFTYHDKTYCIEFQCSTISEELFMKRTKGYRQLNLFPLWILGGKNINRKKPQKVSLTNFHFLFLRESFSQQWYLPSYCPKIEQFVMLENIKAITTRNAFCHFSLKRLGEMQVKELLNPEISRAKILDWRKDLLSFKTSIMANPLFIHELYSISVNPHLLPPYVGIPLTLNHAFETAPFIWQAYIFLDHIFGKGTGKVTRFHEVYLSILKRIKLSHIKIRKQPSSDKNLLPFAIKEYLYVLAAVGVWREVGSNTFVIDKPIELAGNMEEWKVNEEKFYERYKQFASKINT